jgi:hypothetical protein
MQCFKRVSILFIPITFNLCLLLLLAGVVSANVSANQAKDFKYRNLFKSLGAFERSTDFIAYTAFEVDHDKAEHRDSLEYLNSHPELIKQIRNDLGSEDIHWQLEGLSSRLLYVPENREEVAGLFTDYCRETIEDVLERTGLINPYSSISILSDNTPVDPEVLGIKAVIVQDLAREYVARYQFSGNTKKRIEIGLSGRTSINEVGSYSSYIQYSEENKDWQFFRNQRTVWKSVSENPYTVLMTPLEETLHIALRKHTEKAILAAVKAIPKTPSLQEIKDVVEEWLAVEEAIVGGLVYSLVPEVVIRRIPDLPREWIQADLDTKAQFDKYRFLPQAIKMVQSYGLKKCIQAYEEDPVATRSLLQDHS